MPDGSNDSFALRSEDHIDRPRNRIPNEMVVRRLPFEEEKVPDGGNRIFAGVNGDNDVIEAEGEISELVGN